MTFTLFSVWTFVIVGRPQDLIPALGPLRPALMLGLLTVGIVFFGMMPAFLASFRNTPEARRYLIFFVIMVIGIPFAYHRGHAFTFTLTAYLLNLSYLLVFVSLVDSLIRLKKILWVITLCALVYGVFGLLRGVSVGGRFAIYGMMFDPNDIAYVLISLLPVGSFFIVQPEGFVKRALALVAVGASLIVILFTGSRAGILGLASVILLLLLTRTGSIKKRHKFALVAGMALTTVLNLENINVERYLTVTDIEEDYNITAKDGRLEIWQKAYELLLANPLTGVGTNCFPMAIGYLRLALGEIPRWQAVHNSYLQIAVETGVVGFGVFISLIASSLKTFYTGRKRSISTQEGQELRAISGSLQIGFIGSLICAFFLSQGYSTYFTLYFAFSGVIRKLYSETACPKNLVVRFR